MQNPNLSGNLLFGLSQLGHHLAEPLYLRPAAFHLRLPVQTWAGYSYPPVPSYYQGTLAF